MKKSRPNTIRHNSLTWFVFTLLWLFMWIISGWNTENADLENYIVFYTRNFDRFDIIELADPGFNFINKTFNAYSFTFETYHMIVYGIIVTYICYQVWKRSCKPILILFIYLFTAFFADVIQLRNFVALFFLMIGLFALVDKNEKHPKLKFFLFNLLACSIHIAFVFYFIFLLLDINIKPVFIIFGSIIFSVVGHVILSSLSTFAYISENGFLSNRAETYLESSSYWSVVICSFQYLIHYFVCKRCIISSGYSTINSKYFMQINVLLAVLIVMTSINMTFFRLFRNMLLFSSIYLINGYLCGKNKANVVYLSLYFVLMSFFHFWWGDVLSNVNAIFSNNLLW